MTRRVLRVAGAGVLGVTFVGALVGSGALDVGGAVLVASVVASAVLVLTALVTLPAPLEPRSSFERAVSGRVRRPPERPAALEEVERLVSFSKSNAGDLHYRLRPILREIARHRLLMDHGVDLDRSADLGRQLLGDAAFELVRLDRPAPEERFAPGIAVADLETVVGQLEAR